MDEVRVSRGDRAAADALLGRGVPASEWEPNVRAPALVVDDATGEPLILTDRYAGDLASLRNAMRAYPQSTTFRAAGIRNRSGVFGFTGRRVTMKRSGCRACNGASEAPEAHAAILAAGPVMADMLAARLPGRSADDHSVADRFILPEWRLPGCQWTSGVLNETSPLPYHYDRNNLPTWSAMVVARRGMRGGHLHVPELGLVIDCRDGDVVFFAGWHFVHGVTPIHRAAPDGYRYSAVFYTVKGMAQCLPPDEEIAWARRDRTAREGDLRSAEERLRA